MSTLQLREQLSAVMDGEVSSKLQKELLRQLVESNDSELTSLWQRYHLIREVLTPGFPKSVCSSLTRHVRRGLESENREMIA